MKKTVSQKLPGIGDATIHDHLATVAPLYNITIEDNALLFPLKGEMRKILFVDIVYLSVQDHYVDMVSRQGHLFILSERQPAAFIDLHEDLMQKSGIDLKAAIDMVHQLWRQLNRMKDQPPE